LPRMPEELVISDGGGHLPQRSESQHKDLKPEAAGVLGLFQMPPTAFSVRGKEYILLWKKPWILVKYDVRMLGAKNNDSPSEKWVIVKFYTMEYRKCGNFNSKNDSRHAKIVSIWTRNMV